MSFPFQSQFTLGRLAVLIAACLASAGCAGPLAPAWADFETNRTIEKAAADNSIPSAAEVGLAADDKPAADTSPGEAASAERPAAEDSLAATSTEETSIAETDSAETHTADAKDDPSAAMR